MRIHSTVSCSLSIALAAACGSGAGAAPPQAPAAAGVDDARPCDQASADALVQALSALGEGQVDESWKAPLGSCEVDMQQGLVVVTAGGDRVYQAKEAGPAYAWHPAFQRDGLRPGQDIAEAHRLAVDRGFTVFRCTAGDALWSCTFDRPTPPADGCDNDDLAFEIARAPGDPATIERVEQLAGRRIQGLLLAMPC